MTNLFENAPGYEVKEIPGKVLFVSNRLPIALEMTMRDDGNKDLVYRRTTGGLATAIEGLADSDEKNNITWLGFLGRSDEWYEEHGFNEEDIQDVLSKATQETGIKFQHVRLSQYEVEAYYQGASNEIMWPIMHNMADEYGYGGREISVYQEYMSTYDSVAENFARRILEITDDATEIFVQDYHLFKAARAIKKNQPDRSVRFFLHIPHANPDQLNKMRSATPYELRMMDNDSARDLMDAMMDYDVVGFHTDEYAKSFFESVKSVFPDAYIATEGDGDSPMVIDDGAGRRVRVVSQMIGLNPGPLLAFRESNIIESPQQFTNAGRVEPSKGVDVMMDALRIGIEKTENPIHFTGVMAPSRWPKPGETNVYKEYFDARRKEAETLMKITGEIMGNRHVLEFIFGGLPRHELLGLFARSNMIGPSLQDGLNLTIPEAALVNPFGVPIVSFGAGISKYIVNGDDGALGVRAGDPYDIWDAMSTYQKMADDERLRRNKTIVEVMTKDNVNKWAHRMLTA